MANKIKHDIYKNIAVFGASMFLVINLLSADVFAATAAPTTTSAKKATTTGSSTSSVSTQNNAASLQGYASDTPLQSGLIVELTAAGSQKVAVAKSSNANNMYGVTVDQSQLSYTVSNSSLKNEVYVATSGTYNLLVSTQGGAIKSGDYLTISSIDGVAMNAGTTNITVFGRAAANFNGKNGALGTETLSATGGVSQTVSLALIPVAIAIQHNPNQISTKANLPKQLQKIGQAIAEKPISPLRSFLSIAIAIISVIIAVVILYSGIRSSIISIGRNPMSKKSIYKSLVTVILSGVVVLLTGLFMVYLLLKL